MLTVDLDKSDLPLQTAFPIMMTNLLSWFGGTKGELREARRRGGGRGRAAGRERPGIALARSAVPTAASSRSAVPEGATKVAVGPLDHCGVWSVVRRRAESTAIAKGTVGEVVMELACNLADRRESDLRPAEGLPERPTSRAAGLGRPADLVLPVGLGLAADLLGVVPLSAKVDRLMGMLPAVHVQLELTRPWWLLGLAVLPVLVYYFYRSLVDFAALAAGAVARGSARRSWSC